jgi:hypothetical protein
MYITESTTRQANKTVSILKAISWWAAIHKTRARLIIMLIYVPFVTLALTLNEELLGLDIHLPNWLALIMLATAILSVLAYPRFHTQTGKDYYLRRKLSQVLLSTATFCSIGWIFNTNVLSGGQWGTPAYGSYRYKVEKPRLEQQVSTDITHFKSTGERLLNKFELLRQWYCEQQTWVKVILTVLTCLLATILFVVLAAVSCMLVCEGYGFIGVALFVLGTVGLVMGTIALVRNVWGVERNGRRRVRSY